MVDEFAVWATTWITVLFLAIGAAIVPRQVAAWIGPRRLWQLVEWLVFLLFALTLWGVIYYPLVRPTGGWR